MNENMEFSQYDKHNDRHQPRIMCDFCKEPKIETMIRQLRLTMDHICDDCREAMTMKEAIEYIKGQEIYAETRALMQLIRELWPEQVEKVINNEKNKK